MVASAFSGRNVSVAYLIEPWMPYNSVNNYVVPWLCEAQVAIRSLSVYKFVRAVLGRVDSYETNHESCSVT